MAKRDWYCGGYGCRHYIPGSGRPYFSCSRCRWNPTYKDSAEKLAKFEPKKEN